MLSMSQYNLEKNEENMLEEIDIHQEFDILKSYKVYFRQNNCEVVLQQLKLRQERAREPSVFSPRKKKKKYVKLIEGERVGKRFGVKDIKEKSFLATFLRKNVKVPTFNNLFKGLQEG